MNKSTHLERLEGRTAMVYGYFDLFHHCCDLEIVKQSRNICLGLELSEIVGMFTVP